MPLLSNFQLMANYNQWINDNIYQAAGQLGAVELAKDRGAFFGSVLGTLNHILVGDTIWLKRFAGFLEDRKSLNYVRDLEKPTSLDQQIYDDLSELKQARRALDKVIIDFTEEISEQDLESPMSYTNTKGLPFTKNFGQLLQHFFNHQTHHRGQVTTLLSQRGIDVGVTDLLVRIPDL